LFQIVPDARFDLDYCRNNVWRYYEKFPILKKNWSMANRYENVNLAGAVAFAAHEAAPNV